MVDIQSVAAEIRRGKKRKNIDRKKPQGKNIMAPLLHRAAIIKRIQRMHSNHLCSVSSTECLQCLDTVGWAAGRASGL